MIVEQQDGDGGNLMNRIIQFLAVVVEWIELDDSSRCLRPREK